MVDQFPVVEDYSTPDTLKGIQVRNDSLDKRKSKRISQNIIKSVPESKQNRATPSGQKPSKFSLVKELGTDEEDVVILADDYEPEEEDQDLDETYSIISIAEFKKSPDSVKQEKIKMNPSRQIHMRKIIEKIGKHFYSDKK